jgi:hypothetical protein
MWTTVLAYVLAFVGVMTFGAGGLAFLWLMFEEVNGPGHVPLRHYAVVAGLISAGLSMIGIAGLAAAAAARSLPRAFAAAMTAGLGRISDRRISRYTP